MTTEVNVLRVFTDAGGKFGSPLGVVSAVAVLAKERQRIAAELGLSEAIFIEGSAPGAGSVRGEIFTPTLELLFAGHPALGAAWWLRERGTPIRSLQLRAGVVEVHYAPDLTTVEVCAEWTPEFALHELDSPQDVVDADPEDYADGIPHYLWAWTDKSAGRIRSRALAQELGVHEDEATGAAASRVTDFLRRDLTITQGKGSVIYIRWSPRGWVALGGRVVYDGRSRIT
jgi:predicted PhzF superfamily epimerase YddE/YHI9